MSKNPNPSKEEVDEIHHLYLEQLRELFEENKLKFGVDENQYLEII